jgi:hypothetical protein
MINSSNLGEMKNYIIIFILLLLISYGANCQIASSKSVYKLKSKQHSFVPDSVICKDIIDLNPFTEHNYLQISIFIDLFLNYRFDLKLTEKDTIAFITIFTYEIKRVKTSKQEKQMFPNYKIWRKEEWTLISKVTPISDTISKSIISIIESVNFEDLPSRETIAKDIGFVQADGYGFRFIIKRKGVTTSFSVNSLYLNKHEKLIKLKPIETLLMNYIMNNSNFVVNYQENRCYNNGSSSVWMCK